jgi:hypothetical protein
MLLSTRAVLLLFLALLSGLSATGAATSEYAEGIEAKEVLVRYLDALRQGDTITMRSMMSGSHLERHLPLLRNPTWPAYLAETYGATEFSIGRVRSVGANEFVIEAATLHGPEDVIVSAFVLRRETSPENPYGMFRISDEFEPEADTFDDAAGMPATSRSHPADLRGQH